MAELVVETIDGCGNTHWKVIPDTVLWREGDEINLADLPAGTRSLVNAPNITNLVRCRPKDVPITQGGPVTQRPTTLPGQTTLPTTANASTAPPTTSALFLYGELIRREVLRANGTYALDRYTPLSTSQGGSLFGYIKNLTGETEEQARVRAGNNRNLIVNTLPGNTGYGSSLDVVTKTMISGWAIDPYNEGGSTAVDIILDAGFGAETFTVVTSKDRADVATYFGFPSTFIKYGFEFVPPTRFFNANTVYVTVKLHGKVNQAKNSPSQYIGNGFSQTTTTSSGAYSQSGEVVVYETDGVTVTSAPPPGTTTSAPTTTVPPTVPPPATTTSTAEFASLTPNNQAGTIRLQGRVNPEQGNQLGYTLIKDGTIVKNQDNITPPLLDTTIGITWGNGIYRLRIFELNVDANFVESAPVTVALASGNVGTTAAPGTLPPGGTTVAPTTAAPTTQVTTAPVSAGNDLQTAAGTAPVYEGIIDVDNSNQEHTNFIHLRIPISGGLDLPNRRAKLENFAVNKNPNNGTTLMYTVESNRMYSEPIDGKWYSFDYPVIVRSFWIDQSVPEYMWELPEYPYGHFFKGFSVITFK